MPFSLKQVSFITVLLLGACSYSREDQHALVEETPSYCYDYLGTIQCFSTPVHRDAGRLVTFNGPHPSRYPTPSPPSRLEPVAPPPVSFYVIDDEPIPDDSVVHRAN